MIDKTNTLNIYIFKEIMEITRELYGENTSNAIERLMEDKDNIPMIIKQISRKFYENENIIISSSTDQMMLLFSVPYFSKTEDEVICVASSVKRCLNYQSPLPLLSEHSGYDFASRTLVSYGFFKKALDKRWKSHGAPRPEFYRDIARKEFDKIGRDDVAENFDNWVSFMNELV